jgi:hypothetical protein
MKSVKGNSGVPYVIVWPGSQVTFRYHAANLVPKLRFSVDEVAFSSMLKFGLFALGTLVLLCLCLSVYLTTLTSQHLSEDEITADKFTCIKHKLKYSFAAVIALRVSNIIHSSLYFKEGKILTLRYYSLLK